MGSVRLERNKSRSAYNIALLWDDNHWTSHEGSFRAALTYDPALGILQWRARERSGTTGEFVTVPFSTILGIAGDDDELIAELKRLTESLKRRAARRITQLRAEGTTEATRVADKLNRDRTSEYMRTSPPKPRGARRGRRR